MLTCKPEAQREVKSLPRPQLLGIRIQTGQGLLAEVIKGAHACGTSRHSEQQQNPLPPSVF